MWKLIHQWGSPQGFYRLSGICLPWLQFAWVSLLLTGTISGLFIAPADYQQGDAFRIIYLHVPAASLSMSIYMGMSVCAVIFLVWRIKILDIFITQLAVLGAWMTALALFTGSIWGKPMWGTWWIWDARLTSELILLFIYIAIIALNQTLQRQSERAKIIAIVVLVGSVDLPIIHYSVTWWQTLHQGASLSLFSKPKIVGSMLYPLLIMFAAFACFIASQLFSRSRCEILWRERHSLWVKKILGATP